ncbi:MAG TPA: OB-fold domain-containing protein [Acidimicrobiales bacterium]|nr:OB-fold domain-containing protein [Acidimicrobiales bacterium]
MGSRVPVRAGLFEDGDPPSLLGSRCGDCGGHSFPRHESCPYCASDSVTPVALSAHGSLWAFTAVTAPPPGYRGEVPYGFGVVELPEGVRVVSRLTEADPSVLRVGQTMDLVVVPLHVDDDGNDVVTYAFAPGTEA